jgi:3-hydroxyisobutyrate dehydrogenase
VTLAIGFVGIGNMGWPIAANLVNAGFDVAVSDASPGRAASFVEDVGGRAVESAAAAASGADVLITILPTSAHVADVLHGLGDALVSGTVVVDMSSGDPSVTRALAEELAGRDIALVDCPVSGGVARAQKAELAIMSGGDELVLARVRPILDAVSASIHHCGPVGAGHAMKALNNLVSAAGFLVASEAVSVGREFGLDPARMIEVLNASSGTNYSTQNKFGRFVFSGAFDSGFSIGLMAKDLGIASSLARDVDVSAPFSALCADLWATAAQQLGPTSDHTEIARFCGIGEV